MGICFTVLPTLENPKYFIVHFFQFILSIENLDSQAEPEKHLQLISSQWSP